MKKNYFTPKKVAKFFAIPAALLFSTGLQAQITQTYSYTGSIQTFTVPSCVSTVTIEARGAQGGGSNGGGGGLGARMIGTYTTSAGSVLNIVVG